MSFREYFLRFLRFHANVRLFICATFALGVAQSVFSLVYNLYVLKLGYTREFIGTLESIPVFVTAALAAPIALLCVRFSMKKLLLTALFLAAVSFSGLALFTGKWPLIAFKVLYGVSAAFLALATWPLLARYSEGEERNYAFSFQFGFAMLAGFAGNLIGGALTDKAAVLLGAAAESPAAYRATLLAAVVIAAAAAVPVLYLKERTVPAERMPKPGPSLANRRTLMIFLPQMLIGFGAGMIMPYLNIFFKTLFDLRIERLGALMSLMPLSMALGGFIGPWLVKRRGRVGAMIMLQFLSVPFLATMGFSGSMLPTVSAAFIRTMLMNASWPIYSVFMLSHFRKEDHALASALYTAGWSLTQAFGAKLSGTLQMVFGFDMPFLITIVCYSSATLLLSRRFLRKEGEKAGIPEALPAEAME